VVGRAATQAAHFTIMLPQRSQPAWATSTKLPREQRQSVPKGVKGARQPVQVVASVQLEQVDGQGRQPPDVGREPLG
jgi:hypothetical protein